jgi:hypothetical protein
MPWKDTMQVCINGHHINSSYHYFPHYNKDFCDKCGAKAITQCPKCNHPIPGDLQDTGVAIIGWEPVVPTFCEKCGEPYPWTAKQSNKTKSDSKQQNKTQIKPMSSKVDDPIVMLLRTFFRFHSMAKLLRKRHDGRPTLDISDEYDVQDFVHVLLCLFFDDVRPEEWTPSYAGKSSRMDFLLKEHNIVVETKMTRKKLTEKEVGDQLIIDITRYETHPNCNTLVCFVYDPDGRISNHKGLISDLQKRSNKKLKVIVLINPQ